MDDPVLVETTRGPMVESRHRGAVAVVDAGGGVALGLGDVERVIYPRSAVKALQALPLVESGAADRYGLTDAELALACASHSGEPEHAAAAASALEKAGLSADALACGPQWPKRRPDRFALARAAAEPSALHNNCSGKHAGFLCVACAMGAPTAGYVAADHPVMRRVTGTLEEMTGVSLAGAEPGIDGCSIPTWPIPLSALARAFARFGTGDGLAPDRAAAAARLRAAVASTPFHVAGARRFDTDVMTALGARAFVKTGAEGVYCAALPELGLGVAIKCDDGATRASEAMMAAVLAKLLTLTGDEETVVEARLDAPLLNRAGREVGRVRVTRALRS